MDFEVSDSHVPIPPSEYSKIPGKYRKKHNLSKSIMIRPIEEAKGNYIDYYA